MTREDANAWIPCDALNERGLRSRERLKRAARDVLNERGYRKIRTQDVTERAGVASGLFYHYFRDLREVVAEVSNSTADDMGCRIRVPVLIGANPR